jgi:hypothetical protein
MENIDVTVCFWVPKVQIDEQPTIVHRNHIVHAIHLFLPIKSILMGQIIWKFTNFDEDLINESNATLKFQTLWSQHSLFLNIKSLNLVDTEKIDERCH